MQLGEEDISSDREAPLLPEIKRSVILPNMLGYKRYSVSDAIHSRKITCLDFAENESIL